MNVQIELNRQSDVEPIHGIHHMEEFIFKAPSLILNAKGSIAPPTSSSSHHM